jgi:hypothetical protein
MLKNQNIRTLESDPQLQQNLIATPKGTTPHALKTTTLG